MYLITTITLFLISSNLLMAIPQEVLLQPSPTPPQSIATPPPGAPSVLEGMSHSVKNFFNSTIASLKHLPLTASQHSSNTSETPPHLNGSQVNHVSPKRIVRNFIRIELVSDSPVSQHPPNTSAVQPQNQSIAQISALPEQTSQPQPQQPIAAPPQISQPPQQGLTQPSPAPAPNITAPHKVLAVPVLEKVSHSVKNFFNNTFEALKKLPHLPSSVLITASPVLNHSNPDIHHNNTHVTPVPHHDHSEPNNGLPVHQHTSPVSPQDNLSLSPSFNHSQEAYNEIPDPHHNDSIHENQKIPDFTGRYHLVDSKNYEEFMQKLNIKPVVRHLANAAKPDIIIKKETDCDFILKTATAHRKSEIRFKFGHEFNQTRIDGERVRSVINLVGNKWIEHQWGIKQTVDVVREFVGDTITITGTVDGVSFVRTYRKVKK